MKKIIKLAILTFVLTFASSVAFSQTTAEDYYKKGLEALKQKNLPSALLSFTSCLDRNPQASLCQYARGIAYYQSRMYEAAIKDLTSVLSLPNLDARSKMQALNGRMQAYCLSGKVAEATADETTIKSLGGNIQKTCTQFLAENPNLRPAPAGSLEAYVKSGDKALQDRKFKEALSDYKKALDLYNSSRTKNSNLINSDFYVNLAIANRYNGNHDQADLDLKKALELDNQNYNAYAKRGEYYLLDQSVNSNNLKLAEADLTKAISINPRGEQAYLQRYFLYEEIADYKKAILDIKKLTELFPENEIYKNYLVKTYLDSGNFREAVNIYTRKINNEPPSDKNKNLFLKRAEAFYKLGDSKNSLADLSRVEKFYTIEGSISDYSQKKFFEQSVIIEFYILKGASFLAAENYNEALNNLTIAINLIYGDGFFPPTGSKNQEIESHQLRAEAYCKLGDKQKAKADEQKVISLGGKNTDPCK